MPQQGRSRLCRAWGITSYLGEIEKLLGGPATTPQLEHDRESRRRAKTEFSKIIWPVISDLRSLTRSFSKSGRQIGRSQDTTASRETPH